ncbi:MAG: porin [Halochromatium sp.]|uniref:porin n=1 Tax=Halochromatium sp. TaxID=2049430 RepID=UPI00397B051F
MQKKLLTLAVAAAMAAPAAAIAEATLYGKLNMSIDYADVDNAYGIDANDDNSGAVYVTPDGNLAPPDTIYLDANGNPIIRDGEDFKGWGISREGDFIPGSSRASRLGVKGSEDLGNGLKAIYQVELGLNLSAADDNITSGGNKGISYRNSFVGLAGDWGTAFVGRHDTPLKISTGKLDQFGDTMADYNGTVGFHDIRADNVIAYISPNVSGFSFAGAIIAGGGATDDSGLNINEDSLAGAWSLAGIYNNGPFYASLAYESLDKDMFMDSSTSLAGKGQCINADGSQALDCDYVSDAYDKWRIGLGLLDFNGFTLAAIYEQQENRPDGQTRSAWTYYNADGTSSTVGLSNGVEKQQLWQIQAAYAFGNNKVKAMYGSVDRDDDKILGETRDVVSLDSLRDDLEGDRNTWAIGFDHNFSKRTKAYVLYTAVDDDNNGIPGEDGVEWSGFSAGMIHKF